MSRHRTARLGAPGRGPAVRAVGLLCLALALLLAAPAGVPAAQAPADAQAAGSPVPPPIASLSFEEAIQRALERNPSSAIAAAGILRAEALLSQARAGTLLQVNGSVSTTTLNRGVKFEETTVSPRNQVTGAMDIRLPLYAPAQWARRAQAEDARDVAELSAANVRRQTALAAADAYLTVIARRRAIEVNERARDTARAHYELARELEQAGTGSRLNALRAQQELSLDEGLVEQAHLAHYRAQEALGVLLVMDGPVDAAGEPVFTIPDGAAGAPPPPTAGSASAAPPLLSARADIRFYTAQAEAAEQVVRDARKAYYPYLEGVFLPQSIYPGQFFAPNNSWRALVQMSVPIVDSGRRAGQRREQQALLDVSRATLASALNAASSEVRAARAAVDSAGRSLSSARAAADQAQQVMDIVNVSFRAGAATNIEVVDAERRARDAGTQSVVAEDTLRRARLELLTALGRFPEPQP
ncbi:MAG: TolC family protein [Acidobacteria bacterium]|nr:TolC family protein [Acidobacteriota bacterium]